MGVCVPVSDSHSSKGHSEEVHSHISSWKHEDEEKAVEVEEEEKERSRETQHTGINRRSTFICATAFTTVNANFYTPRRSSANKSTT